MYFKKILIVIIMLSTLFFCSACETAKGIAKGTSEIARGVGKDVTNAGAAIIKADDWFRENLW